MTKKHSATKPQTFAYNNKSPLYHYAEQLSNAMYAPFLDMITNLFQGGLSWGKELRPSN